MATRKNVLFVIIDQLRADCVHGALASHVELPNLRALMRDGVSFRNHFSVTCPCGPSRASILTGQYAMNHRAVRNGTPLPHDKPNLARALRKGGYLPLLYGYTDISADPRVHDPDDPVLHSYEQVLPGFEEAVEMRLEESWPWRAHLLERGYAVPPYPDIFRPDGDRPDDPALYRAEDSDTAFLTDCVIRDLKARPPGWCMHVTYIRPHPPLVAPAPYNRMIDPDGLPPPTTGRDRESERAAHPFNGPALHDALFAGTVQGFPDLEETPENIAMLRAIYLGLAAEVDHHLGRLLAALRETGQYDDTLIVVTADHGEMLGDHHAWGKMSYHDAAYHTPLIIRDPDRPEGFGAAFDQPTESVDVAPTILDLLGLATPDTMDGVSLRPFLDGTAPGTWRGHSYSELDFADPVSPTRWQAALGLDCDAANLAILRTQDHALVQFAAPDLPPILLDRRAAPPRDISADPGAQPVLFELTQALLRHRMTHTEGMFARTKITKGGARTGQKTPE